MSGNFIKVDNPDDQVVTQTQRDLVNQKTVKCLLQQILDEMQLTNRYLEEIMGDDLRCP
jgi:hypothetical protein